MSLSPCPNCRHHLNRAAAIYSVLETAKLNDLEPQAISPKSGHMVLRSICDLLQITHIDRRLSPE